MEHPLSVRQPDALPERDRRHVHDDDDHAHRPRSPHASLRLRGAHEAIIVCNPKTGEVKELSEGSLPLGAMPGKQFEEYNANGLWPGTVLFLGTDGIWKPATPPTKCSAGRG
ncbi:MAG: SpoIIE family protein phosphatase [Nibricoccus sp.]